MVILQQYGLVSGYKMNQSKSEIMGLNIEHSVKYGIQEITQARLKDRGIRYLWIKFAE